VAGVLRDVRSDAVAPEDSHFDPVERPIIDPVILRLHLLDASELALDDLPKVHFGLFHRSIGHVFNPLVSAHENLSGVGLVTPAC
jgi:hypothetical protein